MDVITPPPRPYQCTAPLHTRTRSTRETQDRHRIRMDAVSPPPPPTQMVCFPSKIVFGSNVCQRQESSLALPCNQSASLGFFFWCLFRCL